MAGQASLFLIDLLLMLSKALLLLMQLLAQLLCLFVAMKLLLDASTPFVVYYMQSYSTVDSDSGRTWLGERSDSSNWQLTSSVSCVGC